MSNNDIIIRNMSVEDIEEILVIENLCFTLPWVYNSFLNELLYNKFACYYIIRFNNKIIGYMGLWKVLDEGHITNIAVHPEYRNMGMASKLIEYVFNACIEANITSLTLEVRESNILAQNLYKKFGFTEQGWRKAYYSDNNENAIIMWKQLN